MSNRHRGLRYAARTAWLVAWLLPRSAHATDFDAAFNGNNDFGDVGLLQTPTARMRSDGTFGVGVSTVHPYNQVHLYLQFLPWLETTVRYTNVTNRPYGPQSFSGDQSYKDRSLDVKVRLLQEGRYHPALAIGVQDAGGTGIFSSEYLVGSYHWYDFDFSLGIAWGRLGAGGDIHNPLGVFGSHFDQDRGLADSNGSTPGGSGVSRLFTGRDIGVFGGVQWNTPLRGLAVRIERDANDYQHEALGNRFSQNNPFNFGLAYRPTSSLDLGLGYERGTTLMARVALQTNFIQFRGPAKTEDVPPVSVPPPPKLAPAAAALSVPTPLPLPSPSPSPPSTPPLAVLTPSPSAGRSEAGLSDAERHAAVLRLKAALKPQGLSLVALDWLDHDREWRVWLQQNRYRKPARALGRALRVLAAVAPEQVQRFTVVSVERGLETQRASVARADFTAAVNGTADYDEALSHITLSGPGDGFGAAQYYDATRLPAFSWDTGPAVRQSVGGPDGFYFGQLFWRLSGGLALTDHLSLSAAAGFNIINNFDEIKLKSNSTLPHVRSDIARYLQDGEDSLIRLELDQIWSPRPDVYARVSAGIFEEMYGGVAAEVLYRPFGKRWAVAVDGNYVWQRDYNQLFDFRDYKVPTGFVRFYYQIPYFELLAKLSVGQYLARDRGATLELSREFANGVRAGVFATKTDVSAAEFGEGSFDKGIFIQIPFDVFFNKSSRKAGILVFRPLTRDGGQMVQDGPELYGIVGAGQPYAYTNGWAELLN